MDPKKAEKIYDEITEMGIELEPDPTVLGPRYLNKVLSECRNYLNRVTIITLQLQREKREQSKLLLGAEAVYKVAADNLLASNESIRLLPNIKDREATVNVHLAAQIDQINSLKREILDIDTVLSAVKFRHQELVRTNDNIKTQRSLLQADRISGAGYGDEFDSPRDAKGRVLPRENDIDELELDRLLSGSANESPAQTPVEEASPAEAGPALVEAPVAPVEAPMEAASMVVEAEQPKPVPAPPDSITDLLKDIGGTEEETSSAPAPKSEAKPKISSPALEIQEVVAEVAPTAQVGNTPSVEQTSAKSNSEVDDSLTSPSESKGDEDAITDFLADGKTIPSTPVEKTVEKPKKTSTSSVKSSVPAGTEDTEYDFTDILASM